MLKGELRERTGLPGIWRAWAERDRHRRELITMHASSLGDLALPQSLVADEVRRMGQAIEIELLEDHLGSAAILPQNNPRFTRYLQPRRADVL